jgi:serine/threonine protein kinase
MYLPNNTLLQGGKYRIVRFINSGGFGCTYEAEHVMLRQRVAIKEFFVKDFCNRDETTAHVTVGTQSKKGLVSKLRNKFIDEARSLFQLQHPGIVRVTDVFEENGTAYFVMDYIDGLSLNDIVKKEGPLTEQRALKYIRQVCQALQYVHDHNRLHLDIKPGNIMVNAADQAILIDFGASKQYDEENGENTSSLMGKTPGYAPIEQMGNDVRKFTPATDIYALGATLYKLLSGVTPLSSTDLAGGEELSPLPASVSDSVVAAIASAMEIQKNKRPQTAKEFLRMLGPQQREETIVSSQHEEPKPKPKPAPITQPKPQIIINPEPTPKRPLGRYILFGGGIAVGCLIVWLIVRGGQTSSDSENDAFAQDTVTVEINEPQEVKDLYYESSLGACSYTGQVDEDGKPHGHGVAKWSSGDAKSYDGEWVHGVMEGEASYVLSMGDTFVGTFKNGQFAKGRYTVKSSGDYFEGTYKNKKTDVGTWYDKNGTAY